MNNWDGDDSNMYQNEQLVIFKEAGRWTIVTTDKKLVLRGVEKRTACTIMVM